MTDTLTIEDEVDVPISAADRQRSRFEDLPFCSSDISPRPDADE